MNFYDNNPETTGQMLERFFPGRDDVKRLLMEPIAYANGSTLDDPAITYGIVFSNFMGAGVYTFRGGSDLLIEKMVTELRKNAVEIRKKVLVDKILVEERDGRKVACGIVANNGRVIRARAVLSNANLKNTIFRLAGEGNFPADYLAAAQAVRINSSSLPGLSRNPEGREHPAYWRSGLHVRQPDLQQRRAHGFPHNQSDLLGLLSRHPARIRSLHRRRVPQRPVCGLAETFRRSLCAGKKPPD